LQRRVQRLRQLGQQNRNFGTTLAPVGQINTTLMLIDDLSNNRQTETRTLRFSCHVRLKSALQNL
jgi:hypothetical protein